MLPTKGGESYQVSFCEREYSLRGDFAPHNTVKGKISRPKLDVVRIFLGCFGLSSWEAKQVIAKIGTFPAAL